MFEDLMQNDTTELKEMSLEDYEKAPEGGLPYLNAVKFKPNSDEKRTTEDDKPILIDVNPLPPDESVDTRLRMSRADFDNVFVRTMTYMREVESITYNNIQKGIVGQAELNQMLEDYFKRNCPEIQHPVDKRQMLKRLDNAIMGYYVLQPLIDNPDTSDIKVCSPTDIRVRIKGKAYSSTSHFIDEADLALFIQGILIRNNVGFKMSPVITFADSHDKHYILRFVISSPEVNAVKYPYLHIRKVNKTKPDFDELIRRGMLTENIKEYLIYRAKYSKGIVFAGPPGSGKTTALNAFIEYIPRTRETLVIQENDELFTNQSGFMFKHVTHGFDGGRAYTLEDLGKMALVEGCNEFIIGEVKGGEMRNVMTLLNAGGYAALTVHSTNAYETLDKLADLVKYGSSYSFEEARRMLKVMDTIVYMEGYKVRHILECHGYDDKTNQFIYEEIYKYDFHDDIKKV